MDNNNNINIALTLYMYDIRFIPIFSLLYKIFALQLNYLVKQARTYKGILLIYLNLVKRLHPLLIQTRQKLLMEYIQ